MSLRELAEQVAGWQQSKPRDLVTYDERKSVQNSLHQCHLPRMEASGLVVYDRAQSEVALTDEASDYNIYLDVFPGATFPWSIYYVGLSVVDVLLLAGSSAGVPLLSGLSMTEITVFVVTSLCVSSVAHYYDNTYRMRLGATPVPPEVDE